MRSQLVRGIGVAGLLVCVAPFAQAQKGFELGGDASLTHYTYSRAVGTAPSPLTQLSLPISNLRIAFPTDTPFEPEIAAGFTYSKTGTGNSTTNFASDVGLLMELNHELDGGWFIRPAIGYQRASTPTGTSTSRATLGAGVGVRVGMTDRIASRFEARYTYLTEAAGVSANAVGFLAGISVYTQSR